MQVLHVLEHIPLTPATLHLLEFFFTHAHVLKRFLPFKKTLNFKGKSSQTDDEIGDGDVGAAVGDGVGAVVGDGVGAVVGDGVGAAVGDGVGSEGELH